MINPFDIFGATDEVAQAGQEFNPASLGQVATEEAVPQVAGMSKPFANKALAKAMPKILGAVGKQPRGTGAAAPAASGRSVSASSQGVMNPWDAVQDMANNNPLSDINKWSNLF